MERKAEAEKKVCDLEAWYNNLNEREKAGITIFTIIGNMNAHYNHELLVGDYENLVLALGHSMVGDEQFNAIVKDAVALVEEYEKCEAIKEFGFRQVEKVS